MKKAKSQRGTPNERNKQKKKRVEDIESKLKSATCNIDNSANREGVKKVIRSAPKLEQEVFLKFLEDACNRD